MKKTIKSLSVIALGLLLFTNACKKNDLTAGTVAQELTVKEQPSMSSDRAADGELPGEPNAEAEISQDFFDALNSGSLIEVKQVSDRLYRGVGVINLPVDAAPPTSNPCTMPAMIAAFNAYMNTYRPLFQSWANQMCQPYLGCWCSPCGLCLMFIVPPTRRCPQIQYHSPLKVFA